SGDQDSRESLLTFYFTLTEILKANRSLVVFMIPGDRTSISQLHVLKSAKSSFLNFIKKLDLETPALSFIPDNKMKDKALETAAWMQFCSILLYWLKDTSPDFEKTDVFIEKSLKLSFDLAESNVMESVVDLGKFMFGKS
ncbi:TetR family transcriptional regulator C-terminal domain-containing protein, partial [Crocinitomicaceae bacterium]|nr:TetR family transcriptional regulator C-terminal domain-containing protein [Crocinitomicaceae bacterium]